MTDKIIKNEQWSVKQLISKIDNNEIIKPKFQRKKKWDALPKPKGDTPNNYSYIKFMLLLSDKNLTLNISFIPILMVIIELMRLNVLWINHLKYLMIT
jgi:hypothetical protein